MFMMFTSYKARYVIIRDNLLDNETEQFKVISIHHNCTVVFIVCNNAFTFDNIKVLQSTILWDLIII